MSLPPALPKRRRVQNTRSILGAARGTDVEEAGALRSGGSRKKILVAPSDETARSSQVPPTSARDSSDATVSHLQKRSFHTRHSITSVTSSKIQSSLKRASEFVYKPELDEQNEEDGASVAVSDDAFINRTGGDELDLIRDNFFDGVEKDTATFPRKRQKRDKGSKVRI
jgi:hypothetical protein